MVCTCVEYVKLEENVSGKCYDLAYYVYCDHMGSAVQELWRIPCVAPLVIRPKDLIYILASYVDLAVAKALVRCIDDDVVPRVVVKCYECPYCNR